ncbi:probable proline--tRNA ligase, mitochondrial [Varroa jacobsoni]|nr:probable proline--tRNA ligase, mitochondrial [Varroa jacobsoni]
MERTRTSILLYSRRKLTRSSKFLVLPTLNRSSKEERVDLAYQVLGATHSTGVAGSFALLPLAHKVLARVTKIIDQELSAIGAQKVSLPLLCSAKSWRITGRWDSYGPVLFRLKDRSNAALCLGPTHEETITQCIAEIGASNITPKLPLKLYQIGCKFRDEPRPKQSMLRAREFFMKDMYSFHATKSDCRTTYNEVTETYHKIFHRIGLPFVRASAISGDMGGSHSHEYHYELAVGEDRVLECQQCCAYFNLEVVADGENTADNNNHKKYSCPRCRGVLGPEKNCVEVGHTFVLGDFYSKKLGATCIVDGKQVPLEMGCYGIGVSRIVSAAAAQLTKGASLALPISIAPFTVAVIGPKPGAVDSDQETALTEELARKLDLILPGSRVILDDRPWTIGRRLKEQQHSGTAFAVVIGKGLKLELHQFASETPSGKGAGSSDRLRGSQTEPYILTEKSAVYDFFDKLRQRLQLI